MYSNKNRSKRNSFLLVISFSVVLLIMVGLPKESTGISEEERVSKLVEGAKKEGKMVLYTTMTITDSSVMLKRFEKKYPFIKAELYRAPTVTLLNKIISEAKAKRYISDVIDMPGFQTYIIKKEGLYSSYVSPEYQAYPEGFKDPEGHWTSIYSLPYLVGYNTKLLSRKDVPDTYEGFLNPKWKGGKIGFDTKEVEWFTNMLKIMGEEKGIEFMKKFAAQKLNYRAGHTLITDLIIAGEFPIGTVYHAQVEDRKTKGAPIEWVGVAPVIAKFCTTGLFAHAAHPNAGKLYIDFILSKEGQMVVGTDCGRLPIRPDIDVKILRAYEGIKLYPSDISLAEKFIEYSRRFEEIFK